MPDATLITIEPTAVNSNGTQYSTSDHLGTPRVITNSSGSVVARHDYMPFGEELFAGTGGRTTGMGFGSTGENNRKKFTGYERDSETGLDFAQARYHANSQGRFTSPDPLMSSANSNRPQSWNRYAYCFNNPVRFTDPSGMMVGRLNQIRKGGESFYTGSADNQDLIMETGGATFASDQECQLSADGTTAETVQQQPLNPRLPTPPIPEIDFGAIPPPNLATGGVPSSGSNLAAVGPPPQMPTSIVPQSLTIVPCPGNQPAGIKLTIPYQVVDSMGQPMKVAGMKPLETITNVSTTVELASGIKQTFPGTEHRTPIQLGDPTNASGVFRDTPIGNCIMLTPGAKSRHDFTQTIYIEYNGNMYRVRRQTWIVGSKGNGTGLITNQGDIGRTRNW